MGRAVNPGHWYSSTVNGVHIQIYSTLDPIDYEVDGREIMNEIQKQTEGSISLLFYIFSLKTELTEMHRDKEIIKLFTEQFTPKIWEHAILVLSFADE